MRPFHFQVREKLKSALEREIHLEELLESSNREVGFCILL